MTTADPAHAFREFEEVLARHDDPLDTGAALHRLAEALIGVKLFTLTAIEMPLMQVRRVYSSHPEVYAVLGTKPIVIDPWFEAMRTERKITAINTAAGMEGQFPDLETIRSLGCNASLSVPVMVGGELVGTINALDAEGQYDDKAVARASDLIVPATAVFLILRRHFGI
ncbi:GAF domain-containing protein [Devosia sp.]|uniref:GAF domain-containing protein n=1 Tax=Devosia sp. TaxID=1871048 RepID=UPI003A940EBF